MITVSIAINGNVIAARSAVNRGGVKGTRACLYDVDDGSVIEHHPDDGALCLAKRMLATIQEIPFATPKYLPEDDKTEPALDAPDAKE